MIRKATLCLKGINYLHSCGVSQLLHRTAMTMTSETNSNQHIANEENDTNNDSKSGPRRLVQVPYTKFVEKHGVPIDKETQVSMRTQHSNKTASKENETKQESQQPLSYNDLNLDLDPWIKENYLDNLETNFENAMSMKQKEKGKQQQQKASSDTMKHFEEDTLGDGSIPLDSEQIGRFVSKGSNTRAEVEKFIEEENAEWGNTHWSERHYPASQNQMVLRQRPSEVSAMIEDSVNSVSIHKQGRNSIQPVQAGGPAYPIFYDPNRGIDRPQANIPKDAQSRKARVMHIQSLHKATKLSYSECSMAYDYSSGQYTVALEKLRGKQVNQLQKITGKPKDDCKRVFDQCLGDYQRALTKLQLN